ncbi:hypothetical protein HPB50_020749 [Hyalomma asiaticum]|uniref:Uncharacterized protein n=1 Tax=Hyalomma asiaticum TaxID=266040 RepID=A0ACB7RKV1_HYAAI|nr:hypothetical protein HPB50_020749 [Hyalomma asiaticum]
MAYHFPSNSFTVFESCRVGGCVEEGVRSVSRFHPHRDGRERRRNPEPVAGPVVRRSPARQSLSMALLVLRLLLLLLLAAAADAGRAKPRNDDFSLWIDEKQVREFSGEIPRFHRLLSPNSWS